MVAMCKQHIRPIDPNLSTTHPRIDPNFSTPHPRIASDRKVMPFCKDCTMHVLDGSSIITSPSSHDLIRYIGRSGKASQNVLVILDFDLQFSYVSIGHPISMLAFYFMS